ncbi:P-type conjugative transfer protein TrbG [Tistrella mobilis]|uniref:P-type conjugative transfer protein TrbG n=1 Tax=Tistrella mobilis TaxID=171437 RepID=UPI00068525D8|nr:P-type conjugative transfer protein TrbG [Tistrella mobilis]
MTPPHIRRAGTAALLLSGFALGGCQTFKPPAIDYDASVPPLPTPVAATVQDTGPRPLHRPPAVTPSRGGPAGGSEASDPLERVAVANRAARIEPRREGYFNAVQVYSYSPGALYRIYASPGRVTDIALEYGEQLTGTGPIAAGDTARWIIGDTTSGSGETWRVHVLVKPTRPDIDTNLVINTDRRTYHLELLARERTHMPSVAWFYPQDPTRPRTAVPTTPAPPDPANVRFRYAIEIQGDPPPWRPQRVFDDGRKVYIEFAPGIVQGEMPPLFVIGADGKSEVVNYRAYRNYLIVDRLFAAAELRLGSGKSQQVVRIVRTDGRPTS